MREVLSLEPELQLPLHGRGGFHEANACVALLVFPRYFSLKLHRQLGARKGEVYVHCATSLLWVLQTHANAALAEVLEMCVLTGFGSADQRYGNIQCRAMIAKPLIQDHIARGRQSVDSLLHRDGFFEDERCALGLEVLTAA